jgi:hypothetical protein
MNRRRFLICLSAICSTRASLAAVQRQVAAQGCGLVSGLGSLSDHTSQSGNPQLDRALIAEVKKLDREFRISPGYRFLRDGDRPNAYATPETFVEGTSGTILFGLSLLQNELRTEYGGAAVAGIAAHEGAHIVQFRSRELSARLSSPTRKLNELHADFLAGYYFSRTGRTERSLVTFGESLFSKGDYDYNDEQHHGTPQQRVAAMRAGFSAARFDLDEAANRGVTYVIGA